MDWDLDLLVANLPAVFFRGWPDGSIDLFDRKVEAMTGYTKEEFESRRVKWTDLIAPADRELRIVVDNVPAVMFKGYLDGTIDLFDAKVEAMIGYPVASFGRQGVRWTDLIVEGDRGAARAAFVLALKTTGAYVREYRVRSVRGAPTWIHERSHILFDEGGRAAYVSGLFFDISDRKRLEAEVADRSAELQQANERLTLWAGELETRNSEINLLGQMGDLLQSCNTPAEAYAGIERFLGRLFPADSGALLLFAPSGQSVEAVAVLGSLPPVERVFSVDDCWGLRRGRVHGRTEIQSGFRCRHVEGAEAPYLCIPMTAHGSALGVLHVLLAPVAPEQWDARQQLGVRVGEHLALALAKLKLQETLQRQVRSSDIACRFGGEEFTIILPDVPPDLTRLRAERIRKAARKLPVQHGQQGLEGVTVSLGVAEFPEDGETREVLLQKADIALYRAREEGRDRVCIAGRD